MSVGKDPLIGTLIHDYRVVSVLGQGGMGKVYLAEHPYIGKKIAIKSLKPEYAYNESIMARFLREAQSVNDIRHENIIDIFNFVYNPQRGEAYILMEYLEGRSLYYALKSEGPFERGPIGHIGLQVCSALHASHEKGIIHRDLKTDNVFLITRAGQRNFVKILDFGLVRIPDAVDVRTPIGITLGTPAYMSPEQAVGDKVDGRSDIYSLGVILYEIATGTLPFAAANKRELMRKQVLSAPPPPHQRSATVNPRLEAVILRCLEKERGRRYKSMKELGYALADACGLDPAYYFGQGLVSRRMSALPPDLSPRRQGAGPAEPSRRRTPAEQPEPAAAATVDRPPKAVTPTPPAPAPAPRRASGLPAEPPPRRAGSTDEDPAWNDAATVISEPWDAIADAVTPTSTPSGDTSPDAGLEPAPSLDQTTRLPVVEPPPDEVGDTTRIPAVVTDDAKTLLSMPAVRPPKSED